MPTDDDLSNLSQDELIQRVKILEAGGSQGGASPFDANPGAGRPVEEQYANGREWRDSFQKRFNNSTRGSATRHGGGTAQVTVQEAEKYVAELGAARIASHLARNSSKPAMRDFLNHGPLGSPESW
jgi:hypothetical protein